MKVLMAAALCCAMAVLSSGAPLHMAPPLRKAKCPFAKPALQCNVTKPSQPAADVRHLHPADIEGIMAFGDSITAGFGMINYHLPDPRLLEYRGLVFDIGASKDASTIYNYVKAYNPAVKGGPTGDTVVFSKGKALDVAVSGAVVPDLPGQIKEMKKQMAKKEYKDLADKWKLATIFIGANDICGSCHGGDIQAFGDMFESKLDEVVGGIQKEFPKTFLNMMTIFNISEVWTLAKKDDDKYCQSFLSITPECSCLAAGDEQRVIMGQAALEANKRTEKVAAKYAALNDPLFTAVVQPGVDMLPIQDYGEVFLSNFDCFHPSLCADEAFSVAVWNNMFTQDKLHSLDPKDIPALHCPSESDVIQ